MNHSSEIGKLFVSEDWILRPKLRKIIASKVTEAITRLRDAASVSPPEMGPENRPNLKTALNAIQGYLFPLKTWEHMMEDDRLPRSSKNGKILYELDHNVLVVHEVPSLAHDAASRAIVSHVEFWSTNGMTLPTTLEPLGGGGFLSIPKPYTNLIEWYWGAGSQKSPDESFRPVNISPLLGAFLIPPLNTLIYPTFVVEIGKSNETYHELLRDCEHKHFSAITSVQVWLGIKAFPGGRMKAVFKLRDIIRGHGYDAASGAETPYIDLQNPTTYEFIIPKARIFFAVPPAMIPPTISSLPGPNALPTPPIPVVPTDDYVLPLERFRIALFRNWS